MILRQFLHSDPVAASYVFGCAGHAAAAVVDPLGDIAPYVAAAEKTGLRIRYVIDTHLHADHVSAARDLAAAASAEYVLFADADVTYPFRGVRDREFLELGNVAIEVLHTPGHAPEHISLLVHNRAFAIDSAEDFVRFMLSEIPPSPPGAAAIRAANAGRDAA